MPFWTPRRLCVLTLVLFALIALWDVSGLDMPFARLFGTSTGFPLRSHHLFVLIFHEIPRALSSLVLLALLVGIYRPWGFLARFTRRDRWQLALSILGAMLMVTVLKRLNATSCPWDVSEFGGSVRYVSHWAVGLRDLGPGHCFPAGHASSALGFLAGWFVVRRAMPSWATAWLLSALVMGMVLGFTQQMRGAHYVSHTLWTAWICWSFGLVVNLAVEGRTGFPLVKPVRQCEEPQV